MSNINPDYCCVRRRFAVNGRLFDSDSYTDIIVSMLWFVRIDVSAYNVS